MRTVSAAPIITAALTACLSCSSPDPKDQMPPPCGPEFENVESSSYYISMLNLPDDDIGLNIDGEDTHCTSGCINDGDWGEDNRFGLLVEGFEGSMELEFFETQSFVEDGSVVLLITVRKAVDGDGDVACMDVVLHNGVDTDGDPSDNASGNEHFDVTPDSVTMETGDPLDDPSFVFDGGVHPHNGSHWTFKEASFAGVLSLYWGRPDGSTRVLHANTSMISVNETSENFSGILGGALPVLEVTDLMYEAYDAACVDPHPSCDLEYEDHFLLWTRHQADIDYLEPGQTVYACDWDDDCPGPDQDCDDSGYCVEEEGGMDSISFAFEFEAVPCIIDGVADE